MIQEFSVAERSIVTKRTFPFAVEKVWQMWADVHRLEQWWGPDGFTTTSSRFDFSVGGRWLFVMKGPDGTLYPNEVCFVQIKSLSLIRYTHVSNKEFEVEVSFVEKTKESTQLTFTMTFKTKEQRDAVKVYAEPGNNQFMEKLNKLMTISG